MGYLYVTVIGARGRPSSRIGYPRAYLSSQSLQGSAPAGPQLWASPALPGATHDLTAARAHGIISALTAVGVRNLDGSGLPGRWRRG